MNKTLKIALLIVTFGLIAGPWTAQAQQQKNLVLVLHGTSVGETREIPPIEATGTTEALCFDVDLFDLQTGELIGTGTDCLADITLHGDTGLALTDTMIFQFNDGSRIMARDRVTINPVLEGSPGVTHITGAFPGPDAHNILEATGRFEGVAESLRLSGGVDMSRLNDHTEITFDCIFVVRLADADQ